MKKTLIILLYIGHFLLMAFALTFAGMYFLEGQEPLVRAAEGTDKAVIASYRWWGVVIGVFSYVLMFLGVHQLSMNGRLPFFLYAAGSSSYLMGNAGAYSYAFIQKMETTASFEDLAFNFLFVCLSGLVYLLAKQQTKSNNEALTDPV